MYRAGGGSERIDGHFGKTTGMRSKTKVHTSLVEFLSSPYPLVMDGIVPQNSCIEALASRVTLFGDGVFKEIIKIK